jgi:hypothetical protein
MVVEISYRGEGKEMKTRPAIALVLRVLIYGAFQFLAFKYYQLPGLVVAWAAIIIVTFIDVQATVAKVIQTVAQTAWFIYILAVIHTIK